MSRVFDKYLWGWIVIVLCGALQLFFVLLAVLDCAYGLFEE